MGAEGSRSPSPRRGKASPRGRGRLAEKIDLKTVPWWVRRAYFMRTRQSPRPSYQAIADALGRTERQVYVALNPERKRATDRRSDRRNRLRVSQRQKASRAGVCPECGGPTNRKGAASCMACKRLAAERDSKIAAVLYLHGWRMLDIDRWLGRSPGWTGARVTELRRDGWDLPLRRKPAAKGLE